MDKFLAVGMGKSERAKIHKTLNKDAAIEDKSPHKHNVKLYPIKIQPNEVIMSVKVNLKNMEMWLTDFVQEDSHKRGQILQLEFQTDFFMDSESQSKTVTNSKKQPPKNVLNDDVIPIEQI